MPFHRKDQNYSMFTDEIIIVIVIIFMFQVEEITKQPRIKSVTIVLNGNPDRTFAMSFKHFLTVGQLQKSAESKWNIKFKSMRMFNQEGVQYYDDDLKYLKPGETLYISRGQEFDANSSFAEYEILKELGEGGFGKVSLGRHRTTNTLVAIKVMKANKIDNVHDIDTIFRQAENLKSLSHPNIVKIYNCYTLRQMQVIVIMEYMEGGELLQLLQQKQRFPQDEAKNIFRQIVNAINYCHFKNIIHRDLKLENILLKEKGSNQIKVVDFGISGVAEKFNPDVDTGTLKYMSPQVLSGKQKGNSSTVDVWALGCILYYMLIGRLPFIGNSTQQTIRLIIQGSVKFPKQISISQEVKTLIRRMLEVDSKARIKMTEIKDHEWLNKIRREHYYQSYHQGADCKDRLPQISREGIKEKPADRLPNKKKTKINTIVPIPKRLEKQKGMIENELRQYKQNKSRYIKRVSVRSENKNFIIKDSIKEKHNITTLGDGMYRINRQSPQILKKL